MLDTVWIGYKVELNEHQLQEFFKSQTTKEKILYSTLNYSVNYKLPGNRDVRIVYHPYNKQKEYDPLLIYQFSLPKFVYGNNILEVLDQQEMIEKSNQLLNFLSFLPSVDVSKGMIYRIDLVCNYQVGDLLPIYKKAFAMLHYPHRVTKPYDGGTLYPSTEDSCCFYDKELEVSKTKQKSEYDFLFDPNLAQGIWRHERRLHNPRLIQEITLKRCPTILDFPKERIVQLLTQDLERLKVKEQTISGQDIALNKLTKMWGASTADSLLGFMLRNQGLDMEEARKNYKLGRKAIERKFKKVRDAGVSLVLEDNQIEIPPLTVEYGHQKTQSPKEGESGSDTIGTFDSTRPSENPVADVISSTEAVQIEGIAFDDMLSRHDFDSEFDPDFPPELTDPFDEDFGEVEASDNDEG
jgi:hypothetical protein